MRDRGSRTGVAREMQKWMFWGEREMCRTQHTVCLQDISAEKVTDTWKP